MPESSQDKAGRKGWLKDHIVEIIGLLAGGGLLLLVYAKSKGSNSKVTPAGPLNVPQPGGSGGSGVQPSDLSALAASVQQAENAMAATLQAAEQQDIHSLTAQLQAQTASMATLQQTLQKQLTDATAAQKLELEALQARLADAQATASAAQQGAVDNNARAGVISSIQANGGGTKEGMQRYLDSLSSNDPSAAYLPYAAQNLGLRWRG